MKSNINEIALFLFRVSVSSFMFFGHGLGKFEKLLSGSEIKFSDPFGLGVTTSFYLAVFAEAISSIFIMAGLFTRINSLFLIVTMSVAAFIAHADDPFSGKEKALLFLVSYIFIFLVGPGKVSLHNLFKKYTSKKNKAVKFLLG